jgi:hypothetical protein
MYSKLIPLIALFLFVVPAKISNGSDSKTATTQSESSKSNNQSAGKQSQHDNTARETVALPDDVGSTHSNDNGDEDGRPHYYHFTRINKRWRAVFCFAAKMIVLIAHVCFLISTYIHTTS